MRIFCHNMDITHLFKAAVLTIKLKRKNNLPPQRKLSKSLGSGNGGFANGYRDEFSKLAKDACQKITNLRNVLVETRSAYMRIGQHLKRSAQMTDEQRNLIDRESEKFFTYYTQYLAQLRLDWKKAKRKAQHKEHFERVLDLLVSYLKAIQQIHQEQKKYRIQHELETYGLLKLAADKKKIPVSPGGENRSRKFSSDSNRSLTFQQQKKSLLSYDTEDDDSNEGWDFENIDMTTPLILRDKEQSNGGISNYGNSLIDSKAQVALNEDIQTSQLELSSGTENDLSAEDIQMYEHENIQLYQELQGLSDEVEAIEKNVVDIANLQDIFTEKVSLQQHNVERIVNAVIGSTENVKDANAQIRQAIQRNAGLRAWSLFFLLVMSFTLLFLDWYYD